MLIGHILSVESAPSGCMISPAQTVDLSRRPSSTSAHCLEPLHNDRYHSSFSDSAVASGRSAESSGGLTVGPGRYLPSKSFCISWRLISPATSQIEIIFHHRGFPVVQRRNQYICTLRIKTGMVSVAVQFCNLNQQAKAIMNELGGKFLTKREADWRERKRKR